MDMESAVAKARAAAEAIASSSGRPSEAKAPNTSSKVSRHTM